MVGLSVVIILFRNQCIMQIEMCTVGLELKKLWFWVWFFEHSMLRLYDSIT